MKIFWSNHLVFTLMDRWIHTVGAGGEAAHGGGTMVFLEMKRMVAAQSRVICVSACKALERVCKAFTTVGHIYVLMVIFGAHMNDCVTS